MVNLLIRPRPMTKPNNYDTVGRATKDHQNLFPNVGPIDFSEYKRRTSTVNYDIISKAMHDMDEARNEQISIDNAREQAMRFAEMLPSPTSSSKDLNTTSQTRSKGGVRFAQLYDDKEDDAKIANDVAKDSDDEDRIPINKYARRKLFTTLAAAKNSLILIRPKFGVAPPIVWKKIDLEPEPKYVLDIITTRLANIFLPFQPPKPIQGPVDVIITVRKSTLIQDTERIICHSHILRESCNAFRELLDKYLYDMELRERKDNHLATTTGVFTFEVFFYLLHLHNIFSFIFIRHRIHDNQKKIEQVYLRHEMTRLFLIFTVSECY